MDRLRECPFCGESTAKQIWAMGETWIVCEKCKASSGEMCSEDTAAVKQWNTRATDPLMEKMAALLTRYIKETPLGHQPHMIAHKVEEVLEKYRETTCQQEKK